MRVAHPHSPQAQFWRRVVDDSQRLLGSHGEQNQGLARHEAEDGVYHVARGVDEAERLGDGVYLGALPFPGSLAALSRRSRLGRLASLLSQAPRFLALLDLVVNAIEFLLKRLKGLQLPEQA